ncbi:hypothetical protein HAV22_19235 [Massilia sp. TW-1]|uniref:Uncharacterized protein n=1 Tax=Telluria antibiotica TaxID=2717319 RepID=A0ABX0PG54_9BURK|nr:hypothetical protein [Telluria antibiotica]NIA55772.1 hypothetical protein [Telluria antibiotica]
MKKLTFLSLIYFCASIAAFAGSQSGQVKNVIIRASDGLVYVEVTGTAENKPGCATHSYWMIKDEKSLTGRQQLASLLLAQANGQTVSIIGNGSCTRWSDGEDIDYIIINSK